MAVEVCRDSREGFARIRHFHPRGGGRQCYRVALYVSRLRVRRKAAQSWNRHLADDGGCAAIEGGGNKVIAVGFLAPNGDKKRGSRGLATIVNDRGDFRLGIYQRPSRRSTRDQFPQFHSTARKYRPLSSRAQFRGNFVFRRVQRPSAAPPASWTH